MFDKQLKVSQQMSVSCCLMGFLDCYCHYFKQFIVVWPIAEIKIKLTFILFVILP